MALAVGQNQNRVIFIAKEGLKIAVSTTAGTVTAVASGWFTMASGVVIGVYAIMPAAGQVTGISIGNFVLLSKTTAAAVATSVLGYCIGPIIIGGGGYVGYATGLEVGQSTYKWMTNWLG